MTGPDPPAIHGGSKTPETWHTAQLFPPAFTRPNMLILP